MSLSHYSPDFDPDPPQPGDKRFTLYAVLWCAFWVIFPLCMLGDR